MEASGTPSQTRWLPRFLGWAAHAECSKELRNYCGAVAEATLQIRAIIDQIGAWLRERLLDLDDAASDKNSQEVPSFILGSEPGGTLHPPCKLDLQESPAPEAGHPEPGAVEEQPFALAELGKKL